MSTTPKLITCSLCALLLNLNLANTQAAGSRIEPAPVVAKYPDGRPAARWRLEAADAGVVLRHGAGPRSCDALGARDVWVWPQGGTYQ